MSPNTCLTLVIAVFQYTELRVTINPGHQSTHNQDVESITLLANDLPRLRSVLAECKRLKRIAGLSFVPLRAFSEPPGLIRVVQMKTSTRIRYPPRLPGHCLTSSQRLLHSVRHGTSCLHRGSFTAHRVSNSYRTSRCSLITPPAPHPSFACKRRPTR